MKKVDSKFFDADEFKMGFGFSLYERTGFGSRKNKELIRVGSS
jgi:hypothetical protein